jgi:hypothetical protein
MARGSVRRGETLLAGLLRCGHGKRGIHGGFRDAAEWQSSGGLQLKQGRIDESARASLLNNLCGPVSVATWGRRLPD